MKVPENTKYLLFGGSFVLANKLQFAGDRMVEGLSLKQWFLLRNIMDMSNAPSPTIKQVAIEMDSTRQNITKMLEVMEREGLVKIKRSELDHRNRTVHITKNGMERARLTAENAQDFLENLYKGINSGERENAARVMLKMIENLEKMKQTYIL